MPGSAKVKLTLTTDRSVLREAKKVAASRGRPISSLVENYLSFLVNPTVYCFKCGSQFNSKEARLCTKCSWMMCKECGSCGCGLDTGTATAVFNMRKVYEELIGSRVKS